MSTTAFSIFSVLLIEEKSRYTTVDAHIFQQYRIATFNDCWFFCLDLRFSQAGLGYIQSTYDQFFLSFTYTHVLMLLKSHVRFGIASVINVTL